MFGKLLAGIVTAPLRVVEVAMTPFESCDALEIGDTAGDIADRMKERILEICDNDDQPIGKTSL